MRSREERWPIRALLVAGTRPELIKIFPVLEALSSKGHEAIFAYSGQHYDHNLSEEFIEELNYPRPAVAMAVGSGSHAEQTGKILVECEKAIESLRPDLVVAQGDTNTTLAAALSSRKMGIPCAHVEAGLRSYDREMPEEINRIVADHVSNFLFAPTNRSAMNLRMEGIREQQVFVTGNTIVDACVRLSRTAKSKSRIIEKLGLEGARNLVAVTAHRAENVDRKERLYGIVTALERLTECTFVFPVHPRSRKRLQQFNLFERLNKSGHVILTEPLSYLDFLRLLMESKVVLTDSGGIQEEAVILHVPCLTMRLNTERPETIDAGANFLVGTDRDTIMRSTRRILRGKDFADRMRAAPNPFGDGTAGRKIVKRLEMIMRSKIATRKRPIALSTECVHT